MCIRDSDYPWQNGKKYKLTILPGAVKDIYGITNDTVKQEFLVPTEETMAMLSIKTQNLDSDKNYLLQILSCLLYTSPSPRDRTRYRMPSSA